MKFIFAGFPVKMDLQRLAIPDRYSRNLSQWESVGTNRTVSHIIEGKHIRNESMYCENRITHRVQEGDSLYSLSRKYHTTVTELILLNSGVNPYNLQVGMRLIICPGEGYEEEKKEGSVVVLPIRPPKPQNPGMNNGSNAENGVEKMKNQMRLDWQNHIISVKFYLTAFFENLASQNAWKRAVGQNMDQILSVFEKRFPADTMRRLRGLMEQHLQLTDAVAAELKRDVTYSGEIMEKWYKNAEEIAALFARQNPTYGEEELRKLFYNHLDLERQQMEAYLDGDYETDIRLFMESEQHMIELADYLSAGLLAR